MYDVYLNSESEAYSFQTFYKKFIEICKEHRHQNRAMAFAFILYDFENPQISKVLKDDDYWLGLNETSGKYMTVFSINYKPLIRHKGGWDHDFEKDSSPKFNFGIQVHDFQNPSESTNLLIRKYFGEKLDIKYPSVLFFQTDSEKIIDYALIELDGKQIEESFLELKSYIKNAVNSLKLITDENKGNIKEIFANVKGNVKSLRTRIVAVRKIKKITSLVELGSTIAGLGK